MSSPPTIDRCETCQHAMCINYRDELATDLLEEVFRDKNASFEQRLELAVNLLWEIRPEGYEGSKEDVTRDFEEMMKEMQAEGIARESEPL